MWKFGAAAATRSDTNGSGAAGTGSCFYSWRCCCSAAAVKSRRSWATWPRASRASKRACRRTTRRRCKKPRRARSACGRPDGDAARGRRAQQDRLKPRPCGAFAPLETFSRARGGAAVPVRHRVGKAVLSSAYLGDRDGGCSTSPPSKLLILAIVALLVIGPKDLPAAAAHGRQVHGLIKRQAAEFRAQFDEAMREAETRPDEGRGRENEPEIEESVRDAIMRCREKGAVHREMGDAVNTIGSSEERSSGAMGPQRRRCRHGSPGGCGRYVVDCAAAPGRQPSPSQPRWEHGSIGAPPHLNGAPENAVAHDADAVKANDATPKGPRRNRNPRRATVRGRPCRKSSTQRPAVSHHRQA